MELARQNDQFQKFYPGGGDHGKEGGIIVSKKPYYAQNDGHLPPDPPAHLGKIAGAMWRKVVPFLEAKAPVTRIDAGLVEMYCTQYEIYREAYQSIGKDGIQVKIYNSLQDSSGQIVGQDFVGFRRNPATSVYNDSLKQLNSIGAQLGLSPKGRADLAEIKPGNNDSDAQLAKELAQFT